MGNLGRKIHVTEVGSFIALYKFISLINYSTYQYYTSASSVPKYKSLQRFHHEPHADVYRCILSVDSFILFRMQSTQWNLYKDLYLGMKYQYSTYCNLSARQYNAMKLPASATCILRPRLPVATFHQIQRRLTCMLLHLND